MKAIFWTRKEIGHVEQSDWRETNLARALQKGARVHGDDVEIRVVPDDGSIVIEPCDLVAKVGVKSRNWLRAYHKAGIPYIYFDKGYDRERANQWLKFWRVSANGHQPWQYVAKAKHDSKRADADKLEFHDWYSRNSSRDHIIVDGASGKHHYFNSDIELSPDKEEAKRQLDSHSMEIARHLVAEVRKHTDRPIVFRPKPSWKGARPIEGTEFARHSGASIKDFAFDLRRAHAVVTYGSNLCFDAVCFGVPSIVLGCGISRPISSTSLDEIENPKLASDEERRQWLNNCAWCQFGPKEFEDGTAWPVIRDMVECSPL